MTHKDETVRICIYYRKLNAVIVTDVEPIPKTHELITVMSSAIIFKKLYNTKRYYQIPMTVESKQLTTFSTPMGLYEFNYMPFGLVNEECYLRQNDYVFTSRHWQDSHLY